MILFTSLNLPTNSHSLRVVKLLMSQGTSYPLTQFQSSLTEKATPATRQSIQGRTDFYRSSNFKEKKKKPTEKEIFKALSSCSVADVYCKWCLETEICKMFIITLKSPQQSKPWSKNTKWASRERHTSAANVFMLTNKCIIILSVWYGSTKNISRIIIDLVIFSHCYASVILMVLVD